MSRLEFEKWQALGNDYLIVDGRSAPVELTRERVRFLCDPHFGPGADGVLLLTETETDSVATLRIFNPDGSEAELSGNGAREAACYLRERGWTENDEFMIDTLAGVVRPKMMGSGTCAMELGRASTTSADWPGGPSDGRLEVVIDGRNLPAQHCNVGNPQLAVHCPDSEFLETLDLGLHGAPLEADPRFPNRTNVSFWTRIEDNRIRARIFERGVGETLSSGTGASGAAVAAHLEGAQPQLTVVLDGGELQVDITKYMLITLTGWAKHVYSATLSTESMEELNGK